MTISKKQPYGRYSKFKTDANGKVWGYHVTKGWKVARMFDMTKIMALPKSLR